MAQPVWVLSVDLQTKTATFQSGLADAARTARGTFEDIKSGAGEMSGSMGRSMTEARYGIVLLGEELGVHLPRGITTFLATLGPVGAAMEAAFPFLAIAYGAIMLLEHLVKLKQAGQELTLAQVRFGTEAQNAFNKLDEKLLQSQIRTDELKNDHIGALHKELELINLQSMDELMQTFQVLGKSADAVFAELKTSWYQFSNGSAGAKHSLDEFTAAYEALLAKRDDKGAAALLDARIDREGKILELQQQAAKGGGYSSGGDSAQHLAFEQAIAHLQEMSVKDWDPKAIAAQKELLQTLKDEVTERGKIGNQKAAEGSNAKLSTAKQGLAESSGAAKAAADSQLRIAEVLLAGDRATAEARLTIQRASIAERIASDIKFADDEYRIAMQSNGAQILALDQMAPGYTNALKALHEKAEELTAEHMAKVQEINSKGQTEQNAKSLADLEAGIRNAIDATDKGTALRLAAINAGIKAEAAADMQDLQSYRDLQQQRTEVIRQAAEEQSKLAAAAAREAADQQQKMGELALSAEKERRAVIDSSRRVSESQQIAEAIGFANEEYAIKMRALQQEAAGLDSSAKDYQNKLKEIQDKEKQLTQQHENEITTIKEKAEIERNQRILAAENQFNDQIARGLTQTLMGHKSFAATMDSIGNQVVTGMMQNAIKSIMADDMTKERDAAAAARKGYLAGMQFPFPANIVMGPVLGAMSFAGVMAYENGTDMVPGIGRGDIVPARLEPGEGVVPGGVMDGLRKIARSGNMDGGGTHYHLQTHITLHASALDTGDMSKVLKKHGDALEKHVQNAVRKMNR